MVQVERWSAPTNGKPAAVKIGDFAADLIRVF